MIDFLFPAICGGCNQVLHPQESHLCTHCLHNIAQFPVELQHNAFENIFFGRVDYHSARCLFYFQKHGPSQEVIHNLKYRRQVQLSAFFGNWLGELLKNDPSFKNIEIVIPVPLHHKRLQKRGYNQVEGFGKAIAKHLNAIYNDQILLKASNSKTQVFKSRLARTEMIGHNFYTKNPKTLKDKQVLLVDDLITTGATIESCYLALKSIEGLQLNIASMALTR